jgi:hypothetical protein
MTQGVSLRDLLVERERKETTMTNFFIGFIIGFAGCVVGYYLAKRF